MKEKSKEEAHLRMPLRFYHCETTRALIVSKEFQLLHWLESYICRDPSATGSFINLYERYWKNGTLAVRWSIEKIAEAWGISETTVKRRLKVLREMGMLKVKVVTKNKTHYNVYVFGVHDGFGNNETRFYLTELSKIEAAYNLKKLGVVPK
jgi:AraC-like DNA-binding protein